MKQLQRLEEGRDILRPRDPQAVKQRLRARIAARKRGGMRHRRPLRLFRGTGFQRHDGHAAGRGLLRQRVPLGQIGEAFDMQAQRGDARIAQKRARDFRLPGLGLVAAGHHHGDGQRPALHGQVDRDVRRLRQDRDAALHGFHPMLIGPNCGSIKGIDEAIAVGSEDRHVPRGLQQPVLQIATIGRFRQCLAEARRETDRPARAQRAQFFDHADGRVPVHADEGRVDGRADFGQRRHRLQPGDHLARRMHRDDPPPVSDPARRIDDARAPGATPDHGNE